MLIVQIKKYDNVKVSLYKTVFLHIQCCLFLYCHILQLFLFLNASEKLGSDLMGSEKSCNLRQNFLVLQPLHKALIVCLKINNG